MSPYEVCKFSGINCLVRLQKPIRDVLGRHGLPDNAELNTLHKYVDPLRINEVRLECYHALNKADWLQLLTEECLDAAKRCLGPDLFIQKSINLSIQLPGDESSILPIHSDCNSGDSPYQLNIWIPLMSVSGTGSMFILSTERSLQGLQSIRGGAGCNFEPQPDDFVALNYGEFLIFHPAYLHGNVLNTTDLTRVSLNVRFASIAYEQCSSADISRSFGAYYMTWVESRWKNLSDLACKAMGLK
jgi:sporadic carbohydrate cluster 2OG-Fe(II) oxygenase